MNTRQRLLVVLSGLAGGGLLAASVPFIQSLNPSARAVQIHALARDYAKEAVKPGELRFIPTQTSSRTDLPGGGFRMNTGKSLLAVRTIEGDSYLYSLPTWGGNILMPRSFWGQFEGECKNFGSTDPSQPVTRASTLQCNDPGSGGWPASGAKWTIAGHSLAPTIPDLPRARCIQTPTESARCR
jgi:hypothetical protein